VQELALVEDRERIARDLHDTVIQRLFATGMSLQGTARLVHQEPDEVLTRIEVAIDDLDTTVKQIRTAIFGLERTRSAPEGLRSDVLIVAREAAASMGFEPRVLFDGPIDATAGGPIGVELLAVVREALTNIARHAGATTAEVAITVAGGELVAEITDDGSGPPAEDAPRGHGLDNMAERAELLGGWFGLRPRAGGGTIAEWRVPLR
jgi:signal transduction histidine kinase